ncbi:MAG: response regulator transcription factor [Bacillus subtilis]|nr:response regulator transcription factor [Bacillus subtilis]
MIVCFCILVVEDESAIRKLIATYLQKQGYEVIEAKNGEEGFAVFADELVHLIITDIMMPVIDGNQFVRKVRRLNADVPILVLTALDGYIDKEKSYAGGADDYMVKPIDMNEMMLRVKALLRRYKNATKNKVVLPHLTLDLDTGEALLNAIPIELARKEFLLLFKLLANPNHIFTREQLMNDVWGFDSESYDRTVDTHIKRLREHVATDDFDIVTVRGLGYKAVIR